MCQCVLWKAGEGGGGGRGDELDVDEPRIFGLLVASFLVPKIFRGIPKRLYIG